MMVTVFLQSEFLDDVHALQLDPAAGVKGLRDAAAALISQDLPSADAFLFVEDDDDNEVEAARKLEALAEGLRVHLHRLRAIDVTVRYAGRDVRRTFRPSATLGRIKHWSARELGIAPSDSAELMLQTLGTDRRPDADTHVGSLVRAPDKAILFDLVPSPRVNG